MMLKKIGLKEDLITLFTLNVQFKCQKLLQNDLFAFQNHIIAHQADIIDPAG